MFIGRLVKFCKRGGIALVPRHENFEQFVHQLLLDYPEVGHVHCLLVRGPVTYRIVYQLQNGRYRLDRCSYQIDTNHEVCDVKTDISLVV